MELRTLQYFLAVAQEENISRAAETLHLTQPTLSRQMMELERELGRTLLVRGKRRVTLTEDGMLLRKRAGEILRLAEKTRSELSGGEETVAGDIRIGGDGTDALRLLAKAAGELRRQYPAVRVHLSGGDALDIAEDLDKGLIDFGVFVDAALAERYDCVQLPVRDVWGVLMPREHPLAVRTALAPEDLWDQPLLLSRQMTDRSPVARWLGRSFDRLNIVGTYGLLYNASLLAEEGVGLVLGVDKLINTTGDSRLCFRPLTPTLSVRVYVAWKKYQVSSQAAKLFLEQLRLLPELEGAIS